MTVKNQGTIKNVIDSKTVSVVVNRMVRHPKYGKAYRRSSTYLADTAGLNNLSIGMLVSIEETRPISKRKSWKVVEIIKSTSKLVDPISEESSL